MSIKTISQSRALTIDLKLGVLLLLPFLLTAINGSWLFLWPPRSPIDAWIYTGYFLDLAAHLKAFPTDYFGTRLPFILPGVLAHHLFSPILATFLFHLTFYIALYLILKKTICEKAAFLSALFMGFFHFFLEAMGSDYIDGGALTYLLLTLLILTHAKKRFLLFLAGVLGGCALFTQFFLIVYAPLIVLYYLFFHKEIKAVLKYFPLGLFCITLVLGGINVLFHGKFLFFMPSLKMASNLYAQNNFWYPLATWWKSGIYLLLFAAI